MNEFVAKKLGEVLAFAEVGHETFEKGREAFEKVWGKEKVKQVISENTAHSEAIRKIAEENNVTEIVAAKLEGTGKKLRAMRELYVGDQWDNSTELLEWSGFFEGAAVVHWALVLGAGTTLGEQGLIDLATEGKQFNHDLLHLAMEHLTEVGKTRA